MLRTRSGHGAVTARAPRNPTRPKFRFSTRRAAGKLAALLARGASRDLFDARELLRPGTLDAGKLRLAFVVYGAANRVDWRTIGPEKLTTSPADVSERLRAIIAAHPALAWKALNVRNTTVFLGETNPSSGTQTLRRVSIDLDPS